MSATLRVISTAASRRHLALAGEARAEWNRVTGELEAMGLLARVDRALMIMYVTVWSDFVEVDESLQKTGKLVRGHRAVLTRSPLWLLRNDLIGQLAELSKALGLGPIARLRAGVVHDVRDHGDEDRQAEIASIDAYRARLAAAPE